MLFSVCNSVVQYYCRDKNTVPVGSPDAPNGVSNLPPWLSVLCNHIIKEDFLMEKTTSRLTVIFEDPFWIGLYERQTGTRYEVCRIVFGAEPRNYDIEAFMRKNWRKLKFSPAVSSEALNERRVNPKRMQREINRAMKQKSISTKAQQAISLAREQNKLEKKKRSGEQKEAEKQKKLLIHQEKKRQKHRGH